ncbi:MBL fold metallo-hydrolase [Aquisediminimonas profunda]|uniref:MBL fold metallo-hydrolase n=1 Tax=Aquisediminimonas profunda TaxID=1550733 RepID=UPI001C63A34D|nr:MBL fold metallo-hydrolase [Aquisediminimonas profunda]
MKTRTKWLVGVISFFLLTVLGIRIFQPQLGERAYRNAVEKRAGLDRTEGLPDGLYVALCGTGSPLPNPNRAGPCNVVIAGKRMFLVDAGEGSARNIALMGLPVGRLDAAFITHFHSDHIDGLGPIMLMRWTGAAAKAPLPVYGPTGIERVIAGFDEAYATDNGYRTAHHGPAIAPPGGAGAKAMPFALPDAGKGDSVIVYEGDGLRVTAIRVDHGPVKPAVGYRFDYRGRSVVFSGDTSKSEALIASAKGADLLVHEALQPKLVGLLTTALDEKGIKNTAQITRDIINYHTTPEQAADSAREAGVKELVFNHIVPVIPSPFFYPVFLGDAPNHFKGRMSVGEDGMLFMLPVGSQKIEKKKLL